MFYGVNKTEILISRYNFSALISGSASSFISGTSDQVLNPYNSTYIDTANSFDTTNGTYTIPKTGIWSMEFNLTFNENALCDFVMQRNGSAITDYAVAKSATNSSYWSNILLAVNRKLTKDDVIQIYCTYIDGTSYDIYGMFSGILVR